MTTRILPMKYLRRWPVTSTTGGEINPFQSMRVRFKLIYEFWGFCVNGDDDPLWPGDGAFASVNPFGSGGLNLATFTTGTVSLTGSDGITHYGTPFFSSSSGLFNENMVGNSLVCWKSGSTSTDDSIYEITEFINSGVIRVNTQNGGTPIPYANDEPYFSERTDVRFRIVNILGGANTVNSGTYMVLNLPGASEINENQVVPQVRIGFSFSGGQYEIRLHISPSGSWDGTKMNDGQEVSVGDWDDNGAFFGVGIMSIVADRAGMWHYGHGQDIDNGNAAWHGASAGWHFEVPTRLYPKELDPNPITFMTWRAMSVTDTNRGFNAMRMVPINRPKNVSRYESNVLNPTCDGPDNRIYSGDELFSIHPDQQESLYNPKDNSVWMSSVILSRSDSLSEDFTMARVRLRFFRHVFNIFPIHHIFGQDASDSWIHIYGGYCIPWDGARLSRPFTLSNVSE